MTLLETKNPCGVSRSRPALQPRQPMLLQKARPLLQLFCIGRKMFPNPIERNPLAQAQAQHQLLLQLSARAVVHTQRPGVLRRHKARQIARKIKPPALPEGVRRRAQPQVLLAPPVLQVVAALKARPRKVGHLVLQKAVAGHLLDGVQVEVGAALLVRAVPLDVLPRKGGARLDL